MKKIVLGLLIFISLTIDAQDVFKDYIKPYNIDYSIECNIIIVTNNSINYKINDDTLMHHISKRSVESFYITDSIKRCLLTPNKCHDINPPIYSNNKSYNNNSIYLIFKTPITKIDSLNIDLKYTKFCLLKYKKEEQLFVPLFFLLLPKISKHFNHE